MRLFCFRTLTTCQWTKSILFEIAWSR